MTRAAAYLRVSTKRQAEEGYSLDDQERRAREVATREGWDLTIYIEPGRSGDDRTRPEMIRLLHDIGAGDVDVLWYDVQDRFARDVAFTSDTITMLRAAEVEVWEGYAPVTLDDDGQMMIEMKAVWAAAEKRKIKARAKKAVAERARTGKPWGAPRYGYEKGDDGQWRVQPAEAAIVRRIFREIVERGENYSSVARLLNREGVPTRHGARWSATVVGTSIVKSRHVLGEFWHGGEWHEGQHDPIVKRATWDAAQALAERNLRYAPRGGGGRTTSLSHIFIRGSLRCGYCFDSMLPRSGPPATYECRTHKSDKDACPMPVIPRADVDMAALAMFEHAGLDKEATREHVAGQFGSRAADVRAQAERADRIVAEKSAALARFDREYETGDLSTDNYERLTANVKAELAASEAEHAQLVAHAAQIASTLEGMDAQSETLQHLADLRAAVAGRVSGASDDIGALRSAMAMTGFREYALAPDPTVPPGEAPRLYLSPVLRPELYLPDSIFGESTPEQIAAVHDAMHGLPSRRVPIEFDAAGKAKDIGSGSPLPKKLGIKEGHRLALLGAPAEVALGELPPGVTIVRRAGGKADVIVSFHTARRDLERRLPVLRALMEPAAGLWIAWPKRASKVPTDMTEDVVRDVALPTGLVDNKVCAIDATWSGLRLVIRRSER